MNWVGGVRNRIRQQNERKQQRNPILQISNMHLHIAADLAIKEFFERKKFMTKVNRVTTETTGQRRGISQDLLSLHTVSRTHEKPEKDVNRRIVNIDLDKTTPVNNRQEIIDMGPISPHWKPSSLEFMDAKESFGSTRGQAENSRPSGSGNSLHKRRMGPSFAEFITPDNLSSFNPKPITNLASDFSTFSNISRKQVGSMFPLSAAQKVNLSGYETENPFLQFSKPVMPVTNAWNMPKPATHWKQPRNKPHYEEETPTVSSSSLRSELFSRHIPAEKRSSNDTNIKRRRRDFLMATEDFHVTPLKRYKESCIEEKRLDEQRDITRKRFNQIRNPGDKQLVTSSRSSILAEDIVDDETFNRLRTGKGHSYREVALKSSVETTVASCPSNDDLKCGHRNSEPREGRTAPGVAGVPEFGKLCTIDGFRNNQQQSKMKGQRPMNEKSASCQTEAAHNNRIEKQPALFHSQDGATTLYASESIGSGACKKFCNTTLQRTQEAPEDKDLPESPCPHNQHFKWMQFVTGSAIPHSEVNKEQNFREEPTPWSTTSTIKNDMLEHQSPVDIVSSVKSTGVDALSEILMLEEESEIAISGGQVFMPETRKTGDVNLLLENKDKDEDHANDRNLVNEPGLISIPSNNSLSGFYNLMKDTIIAKDISNVCCDLVAGQKGSQGTPKQIALYVLNYLIEQIENPHCASKDFQDPPKNGITPKISVQEFSSEKEFSVTPFESSNITVIRNHETYQVNDTGDTERTSHHLVHSSEKRNDSIKTSQLSTMNTARLITVETQTSKESSECGVSIGTQTVPALPFHRPCNQQTQTSPCNITRTREVRDKSTFTDPVITSDIVTQIKPSEIPGATSDMFSECLILKQPTINSFCEAMHIPMNSISIQTSDEYWQPSRDQEKPPDKSKNNTIYKKGNSEVQSDILVPDIIDETASYDLQPSYEDFEVPKSPSRIAVEDTITGSCNPEIESSVKMSDDFNNSDLSQNQVITEIASSIELDVNTVEKGKQQVTDCDNQTETTLQNPSFNEEANSDISNHYKKYNLRNRPAEML